MVDVCFLIWDNLFSSNMVLEELVFITYDLLDLNLLFSICHATEGNNKVVAAILNKRPINFLSFETKLLTFKSFFQRDKELAERFFLKPASEYNYLNQSGCITLDGVDDVIKFDNLRLAFEVVQVPQNMVEGIFAVLSSVLWLGNLVFRVSFQDRPRLT